jgi:hypothetical protein
MPRILGAENTFVSGDIQVANLSDTEPTSQLMRLISYMLRFFSVCTRPPSPSQRARARAAILALESGGTLVSSTLRPSGIML